jgi:hypothetical protein
MRKNADSEEPLFNDRSMLPAFLSTPMEVRLLLVPPHVFYLIMFAAAILIELIRIPAQTRNYLTHAHAKHKLIQCAFP